MVWLHDRLYRLINMGLPNRRSFYPLSATGVHRLYFVLSNRQTLLKSEGMFPVQSYPANLRPLHLQLARMAARHWVIQWGKLHSSAGQLVCVYYMDLVWQKKMK